MRRRPTHISVQFKFLTNSRPPVRLVVPIVPITNQLSAGRVSVFALGSRVVSVLDLTGNSLRQTVHTHRASVHQAAKLVAALLRVAGVTAGPA